MPLYKTQDMWLDYSAVDLFLITTNAYVKANGALIMGAGIAQQARDRYPGLPVALGKPIEAICKAQENFYATYGLLVSPKWPGAKVGAFQVKYHYNSRADLRLIQLSTYMLIDWCHKHPKAQVALNYPGIGLGGLSVKDVEPIIGALPDTVTIYTLE